MPAKSYKLRFAVLPTSHPHRWLIFTDRPKQRDNSLHYMRDGDFTVDRDQLAWELAARLSRAKGFGWPQSIWPTHLLLNTGRRYARVSLWKLLPPIFANRYCDIDEIVIDKRQSTPYYEAARPLCYTRSEPHFSEDASRITFYTSLLLGAQYSKFNTDTLASAQGLSDRHQKLIEALSDVSNVRISVEPDRISLTLPKMSPSRAKNAISVNRLAKQLEVPLCNFTEKKLVFVSC